MLLLFAALGFAFVGYWNFHYSRTQMREKTKIAPHSGDSSSEDRSRVDFYRHQLGHRLNQQRVGVELQNYSKAPGLSDVDLPQVTGFHDTLGVPIAPQTIENTTGVYSSRYQTEPLSPDHPDARIYYGLHEEQHRDEYVRQANRDYVEQFIRNAKREGLKVEIDSDYNVIEVHRESGGSRKNPGAVQGPAR
jgi:hypothetical protein